MCYNKWTGQIEHSVNAFFWGGGEVLHKFTHLYSRLIRPTLVQAVYIYTLLYSPQSEEEVRWLLKECCPCEYPANATRNVPNLININNNSNHWKHVLYNTLETLLSHHTSHPTPNPQIDRHPRYAEIKSLSDTSPFPALSTHTHTHTHTHTCTHTHTHTHTHTTHTPTLHTHHIYHTPT